MMPSCDQIGVPIHFHSSTTSGSASLMSLRILLRVSPRQSPSSAILFEMSSDADWPWLAPDFFMFSSWKFQKYLQDSRGSSFKTSEQCYGGPKLAGRCNRKGRRHEANGGRPTPPAPRVKKPLRAYRRDLESPAPRETAARAAILRERWPRG